MGDLILNLTKQKQGKVVLDHQKSQMLRRMQLKIKDFIDPKSIGQDPEFKYQITGGSTIDGCPMSSLVTTRLKQVRMFVNTKKKVRRASKFLDETTAVLDLKVFR